MVRADGCFQIQSCTPRALAPVGIARPQRSGHTRRGRGPRSGQSGGPRSCASTAHSAGSRAECESAPARRHTPPAFSTVGFVACLQKKLTKPPSTHPARRGRRESGVRGVGSHYADRYHDGLSPYRSHHIGSHQPVSTVGCVYAPIACGRGSSFDDRNVRTRGREGRGGATGGPGRVRGVY